MNAPTLHDKFRLSGYFTVVFVILALFLFGIWMGALLSVVEAAAVFSNDRAVEILIVVSAVIAFALFVTPIEFKIIGDNFIIRCPLNYIRLPLQNIVSAERIETNYFGTNLLRRLRLILYGTQGIYLKGGRAFDRYFIGNDSYWVRLVTKDSRSYIFSVHNPDFHRSLLAALSK